MTPKKPEAELILSYKQKVPIYGPEDWSLHRRSSSPSVQKIRGRHVMTTMAEVHELLATNPAISAYDYGLFDENMNVFQVGHHEEDRTSQLGIDVLQDSV